MAQVVFNHVGGKSQFFDGTCYDYWKRKIKMYLGSINDQVWDVTENNYAIIDSDNLTNQDKDQQAMQYNGSQHHIQCH